MTEELVSLIREIASRPEVDDYDEATTQQGIILPVLLKLGWNVFDPREVTPQYTVGNGRVDYALSAQRNKMVLCEVKAPSEDLLRHEEQLVGYAFKEGAELAVLTSGIAWWLYLPMLPGIEWAERKFYTIDFRKQQADEIAARLTDFLSRDNVRDGEAKKRAEDIHKSRKKKIDIERTLPMAWEEIVKEPDPNLTALLAKRVEQMCGLTPSEEQLGGFLHGLKTEHIGAVDIRRPRPPVPPHNTQRRTILLSATFRGKELQNRAWKDFYVDLCSKLHELHQQDFKKVLELQGRKRPWFSRIESELFRPERVPGSNFYVEINLSADSIKTNAKELISLFGHELSELVIQERKR